MPVSPTDFYAYAEATGTPVPKDKKSQAQLAPAVRQWRKAQLRQPQQQDQPDLGDAIAWTGLGAGGLTAIGALALRNPARAAQVSKQISKTQKQIEATRQQLKNTFKGQETSATTSLEDIKKTASTAKEDVTQVVEKTTPTTKAVVEDPWKSEAFIQPKDEIDSASFVNKYTDDVGLTDAERLLPEAVYTGTGSTKINPQQLVSNVREAGGAVPYLKSAGLPDFEINARMQAYAGSGNEIFLDPKFNVNTVGITEFENALGLRPNTSVVNQQGHLITGDLANPLGEAPRVARGAVSQIDDAAEDINVEKYGTQGMQVTPRIPVTGAGTSARDPQAFLQATTTNQRITEQWRYANEQFAREWDVLAGQGKVAPRQVRRRIDQIDLNLPVSQTTDDVGNVVEEVLYKDTLDPNIVQQVEAGTPVTIDVPYRVNKARAIDDALREGYEVAYDPNSRPKNQALIDNANSYSASGQTLAEVRQQFIGEDLDASRLTQKTLDSNQFFEEVGDSTNITPRYGTGSLKGGLTGGVAAEFVPEPIYNIELVPAVKKGESTQLINKAGTRIWNPQIVTGTDRKAIALTSQLPLDDAADSIVGRTTRNTDLITTQPIELNVKQQPLGKIKKLTGQGKIWEVPTFFTTQEYVQAPLQVLKIGSGGNIIGQARGQINRTEIKASLLNIQQRLENENRAGKALKTTLLKFKENNNNVAPNKEQFMQIATDIGNRYQVANINRLTQVMLNPGQTRGKALAQELQKELSSKQNIYLPVLDAPSASIFVDDIIGYPQSTIPTQKVLAISEPRRSPSGQVRTLEPAKAFAVSTSELEQLRTAGSLTDRQFEQLTAPFGSYDKTAAGSLKRKSLQDPSLSRGYKGQPVRDISENPKDMSGISQEVQVGEQDFVKNYASELDPLDDFTLGSGRVELGRSTPIGDRRSAEQIAAVMNKKRTDAGLLPNVTVEQAQKLKEQTSQPVSGPGSERKPRYTSGLVTDSPGGRVAVPSDGSGVELKPITGKSKYVALRGPEQTSVMQRINESLISKGKKPLPEFSAETGVTYARDVQAPTVVREAQWTRRQTSGDNVLGETLSKVRRQLPQFTVPQPGQRFPKGPRSQFAVDNRPKYSGGGPGTYRRIFARDDVQLSPDTQLRPGETQLGFNIQDQIPTKNILSVDRESIIGKAPERISIQRNAPTQGPRAYNPMGQYDSLFAQAKAKSRRRSGKKRGNR